jgi:ribosomal protein L11 methyltransferase
LALASGFLGAEQVIGVDSNPLCAETAEKNVKLNGLQDQVRIVHGKAEDLKNESADLVVANIDFKIMREFLEERNFEEKGRLILSGLMRTQARDAEAYLAGNFFRFLKKWDQDMTWFTFLVEKE